VNGVLYGTTEVGGAYCEGKGRSGCGVFFSISTAGTEHVLYSFGSGHDGQVPAASLIDVNGILYGTTYRVALPTTGQSPTSVRPGRSTYCIASAAAMMAQCLPRP
jgi:hypothetical protein